MKAEKAVLHDDYDILLTPGGHSRWDLTGDELSDYVNSVDTLRISAQLGNACTYRCTYCVPDDYDGRHRWPENNHYDKLIQLVDIIDSTYKAPPYNKKHIIWELLGGEITTWRNIENFVTHVTSRGHLIQLITNGVRTPRWWEQYGDMFSHVTLSYHPETADYKHITTVGNILIKKGVNVGGLVMMYPETWDTCIDAINYMSKNACFRVELKKLEQRTSGELKLSWKYTPEQLQYIKDTTVTTQWMSNSNAQENKSLYSTFKIKKLDNKYQVEVTNIQNIINENKNNWQGWHCNIGIDTLYINSDGVLKSAGCFHNNEADLFNWIHDDLSNFKFPEKAVVCPFKTCTCVHDVRARKERGN
jgi:organic radical activating enzyme